MTTELCQLAFKWRSDKTPLLYHGYTPYYHHLLKGRDIRKMLEIGIGSHAVMDAYVTDYNVGASLFMWQDYFPNAEIYALDIDPVTMINKGRIKSFCCDQGDANALKTLAEQLGGNFDLIIDDGSHFPVHQITSANVLIPFLSSNGVYVIEDVLDTSTVVSNIPFTCTVEEFQIDKIPADRLVVIHAQKENKNA